MTVNSVGSGLGSSVGVAKETTYGTLAVPTEWTDVTKHEPKLVPQFVQGSGLRQGSTVHDQYERIYSAADVAGPIETQFFRKGMGLWIGSLMGSLVSGAPVQQAATIAWLQTHAWGPQFGQSLSVQEGIPDTAGVVHTWNNLGCKVMQGDFSCDVGNPLTANFVIDGRDRIESGSDITAVSLSSQNQVFGFPNMVVKAGTFGAETQVGGVEKWAVSYKRAAADKRFNVGNLTTAAAGYAVKDEPVDNGFASITGQLDTQFIDTTKFVDVFMSQATFSLIVSFTGPIIASTFAWNVTFSFPACRYDGGDPTVPGPDIVKPVMPFTVLNDEVHNPATITIMSTDTAL